MTAQSEPIAEKKAQPETLKTVEVNSVKKIARNALGGGAAGATAMFIQVTSLMWMRTMMNYQYQNGTGMKETFQKLYKEGGIKRLYRGYSFAIIQAPSARFGDTFGNALGLGLLNNYEATRDLPTPIKTAAGSTCAALFRTVLMPIDNLKTVLQVSGDKGKADLLLKQKQFGIKVYFNGAVMASLATWVGHYPWFATNNFLDANLPRYNETHKQLLRNAAIGFSSTVVSDTCSNFLRVLKTKRQVGEKQVSYKEATIEVFKKDGLSGIFRGLKTRIAINGIQGIMFSVLWRYFEANWTNKK